MEAWLTLTIAVLGIAIILAIVAWLWYMVAYGLVHEVREKRGKGGPDQPRSAR